MKKTKKIIFLTLIIFSFFFNLAQAEENLNESYTEETLSVNLTIRDGASIVFNNNILLKPAGTIELNGKPLNAQSVLSVINDADIISDDFSITDLQYYESFNSFYLKCINDKCDNWQYVVNHSDPGVGMDQKILSGGEEIYLYFSPQHKFTLSSSEIKTNENLKVSAENYLYEENSWEPLTGVTIGLTQPNLDNPFNPIEIQTLVVNENGQSEFSNIPTGEYNVGIKEDFYFPTQNLKVVEFIQPQSSGGGSSSVKKKEIIEIKPVFNTQKAFEFLINNQKEDGSFGLSMYTDWATIALASSPSYLENKIKLIKYYSSNKLQGELLTDYQRYSMAIMSLGLNPYQMHGENYIEKILSFFDGNQFGEIKEINDDIFALIVLQNAGYNKEDEIIQKTIDFILFKQKENGSWNDSVDLTGASLEALASALSADIAPKALEALEKAKVYLKNKQEENGGWGNISSTSWALQGILALKEDWNNWNKDKFLDYLDLNQNQDGSLNTFKTEEVENKIWEISYLLSSLSGKTWNQVIQKFDKTISTKITEEIKIPVINKIENPLNKRIENSNQNKFISKIEKFQSLDEKDNPLLEKTEEIKENKTKKNFTFYIRQFFPFLFLFHQPT